ncbi:MAG: YybH family protein [Gemmatimonadaceae bacterium]
MSCTSPAPDALSAGDAQTIRDTVIALDHLMNHAVDNLDCTKGMSYIANQPPVFISNGHVVMSKPELLRACQQMVAPRTGAEFEPDSVTAYALGRTAAYVVHRGEYTIHFKNGKTRREHLTMTTIWQRSDSGWRMVHLHESGIPDTTDAAGK